MINVSWKTKMDECQNCMGSALHHPFLSTTLILLNVLFSAHKRTNRPQILTQMSTHTLTRALPSSRLPAPVCGNCGSVPFLRGALPAMHTALPKCDLAACWKRKHLTFYPLLPMCLHRNVSYAGFGLSTVSM